VRKKINSQRERVSGRERAIERRNETKSRRREERECESKRQKERRGEKERVRETLLIRASTPTTASSSLRNMGITSMLLIYLYMNIGAYICIYTWQCA